MAQGASGTYQQSGNSAPQTARAVLAVLPSQVKGFGATPAYTSFATVGRPNASVFVQARASGSGGESITVALVAAGNNTPLTISVTSNAITVNLATDGSGAVSSTARQVAAAINASAPAAALVAAAILVGDGSDRVSAATATALAGDVAANVGVLSNAQLPKQHPAHNTYA